MADRPNIVDYIQVLRATVPKMLGQIVDLAKAEIKPAAKHAGIGIGAFLAALVAGLSSLFLLLLTCAFALSIIFAEVLHRHPITALAFGFLTMVVLCLLVVAGLALVGLRNVKKVKAPEATIAETRASIGALTDAVTNGVDNAKNRVVPDDALTITEEFRKAPAADDNWA